MMPLALANPGEENLIRKVGGSPEVKKHLEDTGLCSRRYGYGSGYAGRQYHREDQGIPYRHQ